MNSLNNNTIENTINTGNFLSDSEVLNYLCEQDILNLDDVREQIMRKKNEIYLQRHQEQHKVWFNEKTNQWMTYIDDSTAKRGFVLKRRKDKTDLENLIIKHYKAIEENPRIEDVFYEWIDMKCEYNEIRPQTRTRYENDFKRFFSKDDKITKLYVSQITELDLEMFIKSCIKKFQLTRKTYGGLRILIQGIFKYAKKKHYTTISISYFFNDLDLPRNIFYTKVKKSDMEEIYNETEIQLLKNYFIEKDSLRYLGVLLVFFTGLRVGELATLKPEDIIKNDDSHWKLHVGRTEVHYNEVVKNRNSKNVVNVQESPKSSASERYILLNSFAIKLLKRISELNPNPKNYLFEENGERIKSRGFSAALRRTCSALNIPFRPMHKIRKTYGTTLIENNVSETLVAQQMGHTDISTTKRHYYFNNQTEDHKFQDIEKSLSAI